MLISSRGNALLCFILTKRSVPPANTRPSGPDSSSSAQAFSTLSAEASSKWGNPSSTVHAPSIDLDADVFHQPAELVVIGTDAGGKFVRRGEVRLELPGRLQPLPDFGHLEHAADVG